MELQDQLYIVYGVFGALCVILFIINIYLIARVKKLKYDVEKLKRAGRDNYAYRNPNLVPGEEVSNRGFVMHTDTSTSIPRIASQGKPYANDRNSSAPPMNNNKLQPINTVQSAPQSAPNATRDFIPINDRSDRGGVFPTNDAVFADDFNEPRSPTQREQERYPQMMGSSLPRQTAPQPRSSQYNDNIMFGGNGQQQQQQDTRYFNNRANQLF